MKTLKEAFNTEQKRENGLLRFKLPSSKSSKRSCSSLSSSSPDTCSIMVGSRTGSGLEFLFLAWTRKDVVEIMRHGCGQNGKEKDWFVSEGLQWGEAVIGGIEIGGNLKFHGEIKFILR